MRASPNSGPQFRFLARHLPLSRSCQSRQMEAPCRVRILISTAGEVEPRGILSQYRLRLRRSPARLGRSLSRFGQISAGKERPVPVLATKTADSVPERRCCWSPDVDRATQSLARPSTRHKAAREMPPAQPPTFFFRITRQLSTGPSSTSQSKRTRRAERSPPQNSNSFYPLCFVEAAFSSFAVRPFDGGRMVRVPRLGQQNICSLNPES